MTSPEALQRQTMLQRAGYYFGALDGIWGPKSQRADDAWKASQLSLGKKPVEPANTSADLESVRATILATAKRFLNLTETAPNARWDDLATAGTDEKAGELRSALLGTGWQLGWAYCAAFVEVCWRAGYKDRPELGLISQAITPSAMGTFENFERLKKITKTPVPGAIMLMQHGSSWQGHAGIVERLDGDQLITIEGNTSSNTASREGDGVYRKTKTLTFAPSANRLWIRGFVNPFFV